MADETTTPTTSESANSPEPTAPGGWTFPWYYWTRVLGSMMVVYGLFIDKTDIRGEIILAGAGLAGFDKVSRSEGGQ